MHVLLRWCAPENCTDHFDYENRERLEYSLPPPKGRHLVLGKIFRQYQIIIITKTVLFHVGRGLV
jgi:hypothetical protein